MPISTGDGPADFKEVRQLINNVGEAGEGKEFRLTDCESYIVKRASKEGESWRFILTVDVVKEKGDFLGRHDVGSVQPMPSPDSAVPGQVDEQ